MRARLLGSGKMSGFSMNDLSGDVLSDLTDWGMQHTIEVPDWLSEASHYELDPYTGQLRGSINAPCPYTT